MHSGSFFEAPILNSPYHEPTQHWELQDGMPTDRILDRRRPAELTAPLPSGGTSAPDQGEFAFELLDEDAPGDQRYTPTWLINEIRAQVEQWRRLPNPAQWQVTPTTERLLRHWRTHEFRGIRPFFCQIEAVETAIWLAEVAPKMGKRGKRILDFLKGANAEANPELFRIALKLATGAGKTTVMAMLIAWQTLNSVRTPNSKRFSRGFLVIAPGITIRDRLRVLMPNDGESYYGSRQLVPQEMLGDLQKAKIVITNYHAFQLREKVALAKGTRQALEGHSGPVMTRETEGQMLQRIANELMGLRNIVVLNDEAHHCYRSKPGSEEIARLKGDEKKEAQANEEAARLWISGIEALKRKLGLGAVYDLSATPFFLSGSGWREGTLFPWVVSDFSLMDAIESGIVKLPRVPVADNLPGQPQPIYRNLWKAIGKKMSPKKAKGASKADPQQLPVELKVALDALYGHYRKTFTEWERAGVGRPPVFIVVCNNTTNSDLVHEYIAGYEREGQNGEIHFTPGQFELFRNYSDSGDRLARPNTLLIDSAQIESGGTIDDRFRAAAAAEIEAFRRATAAREGPEAARALTDEAILREVMNTVGQKGKLGEQIRCVVSVSMLTEGWDANTVTHILGLRAFGTRLICEQVMGRALRRLSYDLDPKTGHFGVEYADIMGIDGLNFSAQAVAAPVRTPREVVHVHAVSPERDEAEIAFPRVLGYRVDLPEDRLAADFTGMEPYVLTPEKVGPCKVTMQGIIGMPEQLTLDHLDAMRPSEVTYKLTRHILDTYRDEDGRMKAHLFNPLKRIVRQWLDSGLLVCKGGTKPAQLCYRQLGDEVTGIIVNAITAAPGHQRVTRALLDPFQPTGSTAEVGFTTTVETRHFPNPARSHVNWVICDSSWEMQLAQILDTHPGVAAYAKNHNLGFEVPWRCQGEPRIYRPDFLVRLTDAPGTTLVLEVKGWKDHEDSLKAEAIRHQWIPAVNALGRYGRWAFAELREIHDFDTALDRAIAEVMEGEPA